MLDFHIHLPFHTGVFAGLNQINCFLHLKKEIRCVSITVLHLNIQELTVYPTVRY